MFQTTPRPSLLQRIEGHGQRIAIVAEEGVFTYASLWDAAGRVANSVAGATRSPDLAGARVAFLVPPGFPYVATLLGIWRVGGVGVPLAVSHPPPELAYVLDDTRPKALVFHPALADRVKPLARERGIARLPTTEALAPHGPTGPDGVAAPSGPALILYTSGTTGRPKGVVHTHATLGAQIESLVEAWGWTENDHILEVLPLHHVHGIVNVLLSALWSGAVCQILPAFDAGEAWRRIARGDLTLFMAVPTVYRRLIDAWEGAGEDEREAMSEGCRRMRLMVSGSAALPVDTLERWREISGHTLLERYGMTEIGMALSNPLDGERVPGHVGRPLPGVRVRVVDEEEREVGVGEPGELHVRGPGVFREYWERPDDTREAFTDGWFRTGDRVVETERGFRILGRESVDIIKSGGEKISALEVEEVLRTHGAVADCAVVGVPDPEWGERVSAMIVLRRGHRLKLDELRAWGKERLAPYKVPAALLAVDGLPRNALGKVTKPAVRERFVERGEAG